MKFPRIQSWSLTRLCGLAILLFVASVVMVVLALNSVRTSSDMAVKEWRQFADQASPQQRVVRTYITLMGIGGLVDDYARLVRTGDATLSPMIYARAGGALAAIAAYPTGDASPAELKAQADLQAVVRAYLGRVPRLIQLHQAHASSSDIAQAARVPGEGGRAALKTLSDRIVAGTTSDPKAIILLDVRRELGLGGVAEYAYSVAIGGASGDRALAATSLKETRNALARYRQHQMLPEESAALDDIEAALGDVERKLATDAAAIDMSGVQAALLRLESLVYAEALDAQNNLQGTLNEIALQAWQMIVLVSCAALALVVGSVWLLALRIARRIKALTRTMRDLAAGRLDVAIPASNDRDEIGEMSRALLVFRDGLRANQQLTQELAESSRLASLGAMVACISHELNTPLGNALSVASTLEDQCRQFEKDLSAERISRSTLTAHGERLEEACVLIQRNLERASTQIGAFKQMAVDQTSGNRREFLLDDLLKNTVQTLGPMFKNTPHRLVLEASSGVAMDSYPGALSQVLTNLIENGLKHGLDGHEAGVVRVSARARDHSTTEIEVSDNGVGISDADLPRIFRAFFTTRAGKGGSGLGLHIVKSIVCGPLGGDIRVEAAAAAWSHTGARFVITLPNTAPAEAAPQPSNAERVLYALPKAAA